MRFLIDEDVPVKLLKTLSKLGHDVIRVEPSTKDPDVAKLAREEKRILITLDKDFKNTVLYSPKEFNIVYIQIHPPYADRLIEAFQKLLDQTNSEAFTGLIILGEKGHLRIVK